MKRIRSSIRLSLIMVAVSSLVPLAEAQLSEKDRSILTMLSAVQHQNLKAFPRGQMTAEVEISWTKRHGTLSVAWDGDACFVDADLVGTVYSESTREPLPDSRRMNLLYRNGQLDLLDLEFNTVYRTKGLSRPEPEEYAVRPQDLWFSMTPMAESSWASLIDIQISEPQKFSTVIRELPDGLFHVTRTNTSFGGSMVTVYSMQHGGNVLEYYTLPSEVSPTCESGRYQWQQVDAQRWALKEFVYESAMAADKEFQQPARFVLRVKKFDPDPKLPANRFDYASLPVNDRTKINVRGEPTNRSTNSAAPPREPRQRPASRPAISEPVLDRLSKELRKGNLLKTPE